MSRIQNKTRLESRIKQLNHMPCDGDRCLGPTTDTPTDTPTDTAGGASLCTDFCSYVKYDGRQEIKCHMALSMLSQSAGFQFCEVHTCESHLQCHSQRLNSATFHAEMTYVESSSREMWNLIRTLHPCILCFVVSGVLVSWFRCFALALGGVDGCSRMKSSKVQYCSTHTHDEFMSTAKALAILNQIPMSQHAGSVN